jgi:SAM-dependent methyltransferase
MQLELSLVSMEEPFTRSAEQVREHYEIEKRLAARLRNSTRGERQSLYTELYEELFKLVPHHPQLTRKTSPEQQQAAVSDKMNLLRLFLDEDTTFLEIGAGDCALSFEVARHAKVVYAIDVSETISDSAEVPDNFSLFISDGINIPVPEASVDVAYSNQLMEHLHEDDALDQLKNIFSALAPRGVYVCLTPNRLNGPHDVSRGFDEQSTGFHLKEYTLTELVHLFRNVGFSKVRTFVRVKGHFFRFPLRLSLLCESLIRRLPVGRQKALARMNFVRHLISIRLVGVK